MTGRVRSALLLPALLLLLAPARPAMARPYSLAELTTKVRADYPGVIYARQNVESARAQLAQAQRLWLPTGDFFFFLTGTPAVRCLEYASQDPTAANQLAREQNCRLTNIVDLVHGTNVSLANVAPIHGVQLTLALTINQPLYSFGRFEAQIANARATVAGAEAQLEREQADVTYNVTQAFWGVKAARAAVETLATARDKLKEWIHRIDDQMSGANPSKYTESDLARLKVAMANIEVLLLDQRRNQLFAEQALKVLAADPEADVDAAPLDLGDESPPESMADWQARAGRSRPELRIQRATAEGARQMRRLRIAEMLPELTLTSNFGYGYASNMDTPQNWFLTRPSYLNAGFGLMLHQPLDFGVRVGRFLQARHESAMRTAQVESAQATSSTEVARAWANYEEARGRAEETGRGERVARGWVNAIDQSVSTGLASNSLEMTEATRNYFEFHLRHLQAIFDTNMAQASLRRVAGDDRGLAPANKP